MDIDIIKLRNNYSQFVLHEFFIDFGFSRREKKERGGKKISRNDLSKRYKILKLTSDISKDHVANGDR